MGITLCACKVVRHLERLISQYVLHEQHTETLISMIFQRLLIMNYPLFHNIKIMYYNLAQ